MRIGKLPFRIKKVMEEIHDIIGEEKFILYGGTPIDLLLHRYSKVSDLDIAIEGISKHRLEKCRQQIRKQGFKIVEPFRKYYIHKNREVVLIYAKNDKWFLDIAFLENLALLGHFNIETLFFRYPQMDCVDKFAAFRSIKEKQIRFIRDSENENPHLLLGRFLRLCSKYEISLCEYQHRKILLDLKAKIQQWEIASSFHRNAYISCVSSLLKSIFQSHDKRFFVKILIDTSILAIVFPELERVASIYKNEILEKVPYVRKKLDVAILFDRYLKAPERKLFEKKMRALKVRRWDEQDMECSNYFA